MSERATTFEGWPEAEASQHVPDFEIRLEKGELLAWARLGCLDVARSPLPPSAWNNVELRRTPVPTKSVGLWRGEALFDLRIFPILEAPNVVEHVGIIPLQDFFSRFVAGDPEVQRLAQLAIAKAPDLARIYGQSGTERRYFWPLDPDELIDIGEFEHVIQKHIRGYVWSPETVRAQEIFRQRYRAMIRLLRNRHLVGFGDPIRSNDPQEILCTIWGTPGYQLDRRNGNLLQDREWGDEEIEITRLPDGSECYDLRWKAVLLKPAMTSSTVEHIAPVSRDSSRRRSLRVERFDCALECLKRMMAASPKAKPKKKQLIFEDVRRECHDNLGWDTFCAAWEAAKKAVPHAAAAWEARGAPRKTYLK